MNEKRKPNWSLCVKPAEGAKWRSIGAAWETEKGNLFVKVDDGEVLRGTAMLFPYREPRPGSFRRGTMDYHRPVMRPAAPPPPIAPPPPDDYMERKRAERRAAAAPRPPAPDDCPDPEPPAWLD